MPSRSIAQLINLRRDKGHTDRLCGELRAAAKAAESEDAAPATEEMVLQYLGALPEQERQMLTAWHEGATRFEIAKNMNMQPEAVIRSLAKIYAELRLMTD